ncbi:MAG: GGDEF domain-containing protein [Gammaproteobacteria bacterium]|nr:GGDEF domain-containing protein [Gammaproteobacteria bacterium]MBU1554443.1 GGDEF domain-containing protein [Gammaproteobacteria bacterium]MBU2070207.1 GGDEF domain-containing protein [Gammaproteobacteria bacterium]MBU2183542.1 GGDEF domain-containing protein [Gammaproteobacteria bacterium]MBU2206644.1 GGDEF domain-containing protein [Gammaproteobacteria bacterium]
MSLNKIIFSAVFLFSCALTAAPAQFDQLVQQIESGQRYFFSLADYKAALAELEAALPPDDVQRQHRLDRLRCQLGYSGDPTAGLAYSDNKIAHAKQRNDQAALADYYMCRFYLFSQAGDSNLAEQSAQLAHQAAKASENPLSIAVSLALLGDLASYTGNYADAMQHYMTAYQLQRGLGYKPYISDLVMSIAATYRRMGLYQDALSYIEQAEQEFTAESEQFRHALIMHEKAYSHAELGQYNKALALFMQSMQVYQQIQEPLWQSYTKVNLVWIYNLLQQYPQAMALAQEAQAELAVLNAPDLSTLASYKGLLAMYNGETLNALQQPQAALQRFDEAQQYLSAENNPRYMLMLYAARAPAEAAAGNYQHAYDLLAHYITLNKAQQQRAREQQSNILRFQFDSDRQLERTRQLEGEKKLAEQHVSTLQLAQRWQYAALSLIALLFVILFSFAISLKKRNRKLHRLAMTDELTNIANRRRIMMQAEQERVKALDTAQPLCFLILDLDHFKQVNDKYGHDIGDTVLQQMCMTVSAMLRAQDHFGRTGGEEFLIVLPDTDKEAAFVIAERLRQAVADIQFADTPKKMRVTCSIGFSQYRAEEALNVSLARADDALYQAKAAGRDQTHYKD